MSVPDADRGHWPINQLPDKWKWEAFDRCFGDVTTRKKLPQKKYLLEGKFPVVDQGEGLVGGFTNDAALVYEGKLPVIVWGDHTKAIKLVDFAFVQGADDVKVLQPNDQIIEPRFAYEALRLIDFRKRATVDISNS